MSDDMSWQEVRNKNHKIKLKQNSEIIEGDSLSKNDYRTLIVDTEWDFEMEFAKNVPDSIIHHRNPEPPHDNIIRPNPVVNNKQGNDKMKYWNPKHIPSKQGMQV